jgi:hypothetical protein
MSTHTRPTSTYSTAEDTWIAPVYAVWADNQQEQGRD